MVNNNYYGGRLHLHIHLRNHPWRPLGTYVNKAKRKGNFLFVESETVLYKNVRKLLHINIHLSTFQEQTSIL